MQGNLIGTDPSETKALGNSDNGVRFVYGGVDDTIGGTIAGASNIIAFNASNGVSVELNVVSPNIDTAILGNAIFSNGGLGISVDTTAPQAAPIVTSAITNGLQTTITGTVTGAANSTFRIEFFSNPAGTSQGETYLGFVNVMTNGSGSGSFSFTPASAVATGLNITATATDPFGDASEFSAAVTVQSNVTSDVSVKSGGFVYQPHHASIHADVDDHQHQRRGDHRADRAGAPQPQERHARQPDRRDAGQPLHHRAEQRLAGRRPELDHHARLRRPDTRNDHIHRRVSGRPDTRPEIEADKPQRKTLPLRGGARS